ncbi:hypothetical protein CSB20_14085 [bacterium DOLZORAL124_64_63]|nr:MAG: hypothetical protein CSB20_14085 [bacterium DOLZORAL124_64_63]
MKRWLILFCLLLAGASRAQDAGPPAARSAASDSTTNPQPDSRTEVLTILAPQAMPEQVTRHELSGREMEMLPGFGGDAVKSLQSLPGVARPAITDPGAIIVRGSGNYDTRFILDGVDIPNLFHFGGVKSTYNSLGLGGIELRPGGFGAQYGGCVGGVVTLEGRGGRRDRWRTVLDTGFLDAGFHTEGPLGQDVSLLINARRSFIGELADLALRNNDSISLAIAPYYWDGVLRLDYDAGGAHRFFLTAFAGQDRMDLVFPEESSGSPAVSEATNAVGLDVVFRRFILGWDAFLGERWHNHLRLSVGHDRNSAHLAGDFRFDGRGPMYSLRNDLEIILRRDLVSHVGVDAIFAPFTYTVEVNGYEESRLEDKKFSDVGVYAALAWEIRPGLTLKPGVRYDHYHHLAKGEPSLRAQASWDYKPGRRFTAAVGSYNQDPRPTGQATDPVYGNPDLPPTTARHITLGHEWRLNDGLTLKIEGYHNIQERVPALTDSADLNFLADSEARMHGVELMLRKEAGDGFFGWVSYSLGSSQRRYARDPGNGGDWHADQWLPYEMDQTHHLQAVGSWDLGGGWFLGSRVQFVSGVPVTPILGYTGNRYEFDADTGDYVPVLGAHNAERVSPYFRTDLRVDKRFARGNKVWSFYLDLQNANYFLYNSPEGYTYNYDYSRRGEYGWIFMPALGARVDF